MTKRAAAASATPTSRCKVLLLDSWYDAYRGVVCLVRVVDGVMRPKQKMRFMAAAARLRGADHRRLRPVPARDRPSWAPARSGFFTAAIKEVADARVGDTITEAGRPCRGRCPASSRPSRWCSPASSPPIRPATRTCATRWTSCGSTTPRSRASRRLGGAGLRLPLRLPGPAAHGDRAGAARARIQPGPHHHRARRCASACVLRERRA